MCLLAVLSNVRADAPLVIAANRDELLERAAVSMTVLQPFGPRILGGRDAVAGGTWLTVNDHGVVAGLTNLPALAVRAERDSAPGPARKSRGRLPLLLAAHADAAKAVESFRAAVKPADYNPAWILAGDRRAVFYVDVTAGDAPAVTKLADGIHVLENRPLGADSPKVDFVRGALAGIETCPFNELVPRLLAILKSHEIPPRAKETPTDALRPIETHAACVHAGIYGTRSTCVVVVPAKGRPRVTYTDGPPCTSAPMSADDLW